MPPEWSLHQVLRAESFLEYAFLRWVLTPSVSDKIVDHIVPQREVHVGERTYRIDYEILGQDRVFAIELDGFEFHGTRHAFTYDRVRQNDLQATGRVVVRFSYDAIRCQTALCIAQFQAILGLDPLLSTLLVPRPAVEVPAMEPDPLSALAPAQHAHKVNPMDSYFDSVRSHINQRTLRDCQTQAFAALANYFRAGGRAAACVMSVGAGKTALGVVACLAFTQRRALIVTPGSVIRGTFDRAFDHEAVGNALYGLPGGPLIPGCPPPRVLTLDREEGAIRAISRDQLLAADVIITNIHSL